MLASLSNRIALAGAAGLAVLIASLFFAWRAADSALADARATISDQAARITAIDTERKAAVAGLTLAAARKDRIREIIREVPTPVSGEACRRDPGVADAYALIERMRDAGKDRNARTAPGGASKPMPSSKPDARSGHGFGLDRGSAPVVLGADRRHAGLG